VRAVTLPDIARRQLQPLDFALLAAALVGLAAWITALDRLPSDYDEVYHAHAIWLIAQGERPDHDFLAVHTPFLWYGAAKVLPWLPDSPRMLLPLRIATGIGTLVWLAALISNFRSHESCLSLRWILAGLGTVLLSAPVLAYAVEFRPDCWALALYFTALLYLRRRKSPPASIRSYAFYAFFATWASVMSLKVGPFAVAFAFFDLLRLAPRVADLRAALLGQISGAAAALGMAWSLLQWMHIDARLVFQFACQFQWLFEQNTGFSHGLLQSLLANPLPLLVGSAGILAWGVHLVRNRKAPDPFQASVLAVLIWELVQVHRPYKQYFGPWLLMATPFFAYVEPFCTLPGLRKGLLGLLLVIAGLAGALSIARLRANELGPKMQELQELIAALSGEKSPIIAPPPFHPIVRRDVFYAWSRTTDPHGYTTERAMSDLGLSEFVSAERYRQELGRGDPSVIVLPLPGEELYDPVQSQVISEFLHDNAERYDVLKNACIRPLAMKRAESGAP
jgi:hypothetical protein